MANLLDRLRDDGLPTNPVDPQDYRIGVHEFYAALTGIADGQVSRAQVENAFNISTTGVDAVQMDFIVAGFHNASDKNRYLNSLHAVLMAVGSFDLSNQDIQNWLTAAQASWS